MPKLFANGIHIYYEQHGSGDPLLLIPGLGYGLWMWHKMIPGLAEHFQVIAMDNRGVGQSDKPPGPYSAQLLAQDSAALIEALEIEPTAVLGHSMGGFVAQSLVLSRPDLVDRLVLSATNFGGPNHVPVTPEALAVLGDVSGDPMERLKRGILISCAPGFGERHPEVVEEWLEHRRQHPLDPRAYQAQLGVGLGLLSPVAAFEGHLQQVQAPTLILFGRHDKVVPPANAELLAGEIPGSRVVILPEAGHFYPLETPRAAVEAVVEFLQSTGD